MTVVPMVDTTINGRWNLLLPEHRAVRPEWVTGWETARLDDMAVRLNPGNVIYDIGAEEGDLPALWASWGCSVVLAEPNPRVWPNIRCIWEANHLPKPLMCWVGFMGEELRATTPDWAAALASPSDGWPRCAHGEVIGDHGFLNLWERTDVPVTTVDALAACTTPPDALTIDVEGSELAVLRGAKATLRDHRPIVWVSIHPEMMFHHYGSYAGELFAFMRLLGYRHQVLDFDHEWHVRFEAP